MLTLKGLHWSNCFSYGEDNYIPLNQARVTQLVGKNGHGKSSIPLILQEILFNKNGKGIKKADVINRFTDSKTYDIAIEFDLSGSEYFFRIERKGATTKTELLKDGEDIGAHTATATYKQVGELLGMDFSTFCQLVYQSTTSSLEFLTATDTQRKKFLITLLNLSEYSSDERILKATHSEVFNELSIVQSAVDTITSWLSKNESIDTSMQEIVEVPEDPKDLRNELAEINAKARQHSELERQIAKQARVQKEIDELERQLSLGKPIEPEYTLAEVQQTKGKVLGIKQSAKSMRDKMAGLGDTCATCTSKINKATVYRIIEEQDAILAKCEDKLGEILDREQETQLRLGECDAYKKGQDRRSALLLDLDDSIPRVCDSVDSLKHQANSLTSQIYKAEQGIKRLQAANEKASAHNQKIQFVLEQSAKYAEELKTKSVELEELQRRVARLEILKRAFSTKGLVAYKIESMIKDLENIINHYLIAMADGRFNLAFVVSGDKLNVDLLDSGNPVSIAALSSGELARVNIATLLAIRKLMNTLSNTKLNLLFLDEVTSVLDDEGKEKLVEILNKETDINAFIVSHGWQHPLVTKYEIIKTDNISRVEV